MLLKSDLKNRLQRCNLKVDEQVEETIHSMTERYTKAMFPQSFKCFRCFFNI